MAIEPVAAFGDRKPVKLWVWNDVIACATYPGPRGNGVNGYVQLPVRYPDLEAAKERSKDKELEAISTGLPSIGAPDGYDAIEDLGDIQVHGGLTYGPDDAGWIGFDTAHAGDDWSQEELRRILYDTHREIWEALLELQKVLGEDSWPPGRIGNAHPADPWYRLWTEQQVEDEVNDLALQVFARHTELALPKLEKKVNR